MRYLLILILLSCKSFNNKENVNRPKTSVVSVGSDKVKENQGDSLFKLSDTTSDIEYINSFLKLVYSKNDFFLYSNTRKYFPSNEEELAVIESNYKEGRMKVLLEDSIYSSSNNHYRSKFFPNLSRELHKKIPNKVNMKVVFDGFSVIDEPQGNHFDTSYVKYKVFVHGKNNHFRIVVPFIRDNDFSIANIYDENDISLIESACSMKIK